MNYSVTEAVQILSRVPKVLRTLLQGLDENWLTLRKSEDAFTPSDVVGHLIFGEQTDWIPRMNIMLTEDANKTFPPFNREGFDKNASLDERLALFETLRQKNINSLIENLKPADLSKKGIHPSLGEVTLEQHLATWVVHDLTHLFQILETLAHRYKDTVGPWIDYLKILRL